MFNLVFQVFNFIIFMAILFYVFKRYLLNDIATDIRQANNQVYGLEKSVGELNEELQTQQLAVQEQKISYDQLLKRVQQWQTICLDRQILRRAEQDRILADLVVKRAAQSQMLVNYRLQKKLTKLIIRNSMQDLKAYFGKFELASQYQADLINSLANRKR